MLSLLYLVVVTLVRLVASGGQRCPDARAKDLEILVLRHQIRVLRRTSLSRFQQPDERLRLTSGHCLGGPAQRVHQGQRVVIGQAQAGLW